jgi:hypothetical protein
LAVGERDKRASQPPVALDRRWERVEQPDRVRQMLATGRVRGSVAFHERERHRDLGGQHRRVRGGRRITRQYQLQRSPTVPDRFVEVAVVMPVSGRPQRTAGPPHQPTVDHGA